MTVEVRTPFGVVSTLELSNDGLYRKQILEFRTIDYTDRSGKKRKITFDREYGEELVRAFREGAYPQVPFQLADADNRHTNAPDRTGGEVVRIEMSADGSGVDGLLRLWGKGYEVIEQNPKLGVSARILENATQPDGRTFPRALQHVLGTVDPQIRGMRPWEKVSSLDLSTGTVPETLLDLSGATYERSAAMPAQSNANGTVTLEMSPERAARLQQLLDDDEAFEALTEQLDEMGLLDENEEPDEESDENEEEPVETTLSAPVVEAIELANSQIAAQGQQIVELTHRLAQQRVEAEVAEFQREGLAPAILEAARPLLAVETGAVELSNGTAATVDPGEVLREVLTNVIELAKSGHLLVDPDTEEGDLVGNSNSQAVAERNALVDDWENYGG